jgi:hypothetical protein
MNRAFVSFVIGGVFVCAVQILGRLGFATPIPFVVLSPGIMAGAIAPDSGFNPEGDTHPWGPVSVVIVYAVNIGIYGGAAYLIFHFLRWPRRASK